MPHLGDTGLGRRFVLLVTCPDSRDFQVAINVGRILGAAEANAKEHGRFAAAYPWGVSNVLLKDPVNPFTEDVSFVTVWVESAENPGDIAYIGDPAGQHCVVAARLSTGKVIGSYSELN